jgi:hypothetical protein
MSEQKQSPIIEYATPRPRPRGGVLGAIPGLICLIAWVGGLGAIFMGIWAAAVAFQFWRIDVDQILFAGAILAFGIALIWIALRVDRAYRAPADG